MTSRGGKKLDMKVILLDDTMHTFRMTVRTLGRDLYDEVVKHLNLVEDNYFDLEYTDINGVQCWLDPDKAILKQVNTSNDLTFRFSVKFYTPDPGILEEDYTRYLFALQIKRDLAQGVLPVTDNTSALLAAYITQSEFGDYNTEDCPDHSYLQNFNFVPNQNDELEAKIMEYHKTMSGQNPAEADFNLLDTARKVELYGLRMHPATDHEGVPLNLTVAHMGILVFQSATKINTFSWAKVRKLSFKRRVFLIKLHSEGYGYYKDIVEFFFNSRNECKNFWKKCIEHHAFFRCLTVKRVPRNKTRVLSRGSSFRYSGKTQKQLVDHVREQGVRSRPFDRSQSMRSTRSMGNQSSTLNSRDAQLSMLSAASSGSHVLETTNTPASSTRIETALVHDDTTNGILPENGRPPVLHKPAQPSYPGLHGRKFSAPVFTTAHPAADLEDLHLSRSHEVQNIPESLQEENHFTRTREFSDLASEIAEVDETQAVHDEHEHQYENKARPHNLIRQESEPSHEMHRIHSDTDVGRSLSMDLVATDSIERVDEEPRSPVILPDRVTTESSDTLETNSSTNFSSQTPNDSFILARNHRDYIHGGDVSSVTTNSHGSLSLVSNSDGEMRGKVNRYSADKAYFVAKELLMTERTYKKDLEVMTVWFRNAVSRQDIMPDDLMQVLFLHLDPIYEFHCSFLREVEQRLAMWEGKSNAHINGDYQRIGDVMLNNMKVLQLYQNYIEHHEEILTELELATRRNKRFEQAYKDFESQKVCYLPLNTFLLKPAQRLLHYQLILERLLRQYNEDHPDFKDCEASLRKVMELTNSFKDVMLQLENLQKLLELQRDLVGVDNLVQPGREFIREGCLQKLSRKGYQQRMFFLLSDMLVYTSRSATPALQFKVHGQIPLRGMIVEETDPKMAVANSFTIYGGNRCLLVAASSPEEKDKWIEDLNDAIAAAKERGENKLQQLQSLKSSQGSEDGNDDGDIPPSPSTERQVQHRANTTMHVCWHRNTSVSMNDHSTAVKNQLSGYLLRKFKNSNGWQKLWVVFTNFCLFFYKTFQDDFPLASLPLLGYSVSRPADEDGIHKDYVFKLQFKNHVYFFRAESEYTFERWIEVINSATTSARRLRTFSRMESQLD